MKWSRLRRNEKQFLLVCIAPILLIMAISLILMLKVGSEMASFIQLVLYAAWFVAMFTYIIIDSKSRWPQVSAFQRFANVITFKR